jgi:thiol-disulfide isomerase/thioredoxin
MSALKVCTAACSETAKYTIFGLDFGWFGIAFFAASAFALGLRTRYTRADRFLFLLIMAAAGAELRFVWLQKYAIGQWCPVCLWTATAVYSAAVILLYERRNKFKSLGDGMGTYLKHTALVVVVLVIGFTGAFCGVRKEAEAAGIDPYLGKTDSATLVYFISDWFCPGCRKVEPEIERMYPEIARQAKIGFVDYPIHPETSNFTPYHLQFLLHEKDKYIQLRKALTNLSMKTKSPTNEEVQATVAPFGVKLRQLNFMDVMAGMKLNESIYRGFGIRATPSVVVTNTKTKKTRTFVGDNQITRQAVKAAIAEVGK